MNLQVYCVGLSNYLAISVSLSPHAPRNDTRTHCTLSVGSSCAFSVVFLSAGNSKNYNYITITAEILRAALPSHARIEHEAYFLIKEFLDGRLFCP